jgi:NAD(P)-dependent dehydrogenase (short-subunit alcohol dehydrogenase family)
MVSSCPDGSSPCATPCPAAAPYCPGIDGAGSPIVCEMELGIEGRVFLVTGGTYGLGAALAESLIGEGAKVCVCGRDGERVQACADRLDGSGLAVQADVTVAADAQRLIDAAIERWGRVDGVVNNAGRSSSGTLLEVSDEKWDQDLQLKVVGPTRLLRMALPHLIESGHGAIVNTLNIGAKAPGALSLPTSASRAAGLAMTKALSKELAPHGIRVNAVLVGLVESGQWERIAQARGQLLSDLYTSMGERIPLGRVGKASEYADTVAFLLSDRASFVTGSALNLDGGASPAI